MTARPRGWRSMQRALLPHVAPSVRRASTLPIAHGARAGTPWSMSCCRRVSTMPGLAATDGLRFMFCHINTSASHPLSPQRERCVDSSQRGQKWGQTLRGDVAPLQPGRDGRCVHIVLSAARSAAPRHLVGAARLHATATAADVGEGRRFVPPQRRGQRPQSGQERPPRQGRFAAPALTPEGVAPARSARPPSAEETTRVTRFPFLFRRAFARRNLTFI